MLLLKPNASPAPFPVTSRKEERRARAASNSPNGTPTDAGVMRKVKDQRGEQAGNDIPEGPLRLTF